MSVDHERRNQLLDALSRLHRDADQSDEAKLRRQFLPLWDHGRALEDDVMIVRGERGTGKTMLFRVLNSVRDRPDLMQQMFRSPRPTKPQWLEGFSSQMDHPAGDAVVGFAKRGVGPLRRMWLAHLAARLAESLEELPWDEQAKWRDRWRLKRNEVAEWGELSDEDVARAMNYLDRVERLCQDREESIVVTYDHLDRIGILEREVREQTSAALLLLWLNLSNRYRWLRAKIFIREDLFEAGSAAGADASKLKSRSVRLRWDADSLYRMLIRSMANQHPDLASWIQEGVNGVPLEDRGELGLFPPESLPEEGRVSRRGFAQHFVGKYMGAGPKKGQVHTWLLTKLQDAHEQIAPRSLLELVANAAEGARRSPKAKYSRLLTPPELTAALEETSRRRASEIREEHPIVERLENLRGTQVPAASSKIVSLLRPIPKDPLPNLRPEEAASELLRLGVLLLRERERLDVPDIYRFGFGIKRKGGTRKID